MKDAYLTVAAPWGAFPSEQFLIRNWDYGSPDSPSDQRRRLIRDYLSLEEIPQEWDGIRESCRQPNNILSRVPSNEEIETILEPWRDSKIRETAYHIWRAVMHQEGEMVLLRLVYPSSSHTSLGKEVDTDALFSEFVDEWMEVHEDSPWLVQDSAAHFDHADWSRVYDFVPELAGPSYGHSRTLVASPEELFKQAQADLRTDFNRRLSIETDEQLVYNGPGASLQAMDVDGFMLVADEEAFRTGQLQVVWTDIHGEIVRSTRYHHLNDLQGLAGGWYRGTWLTDFGRDIVNNGENVIRPCEVTLGDKYYIHGKLGRELYGVSDLLKSERIGEDLETTKVTRE